MENLNELSCQPNKQGPEKASQRRRSGWKHTFGSSCPIPTEMKRKCKNRVQTASHGRKIHHPSPETLPNFLLGSQGKWSQHLVKTETAHLWITHCFLSLFCPFSSGNWKNGKQGRDLSCQNLLIFINVSLCSRRKVMSFIHSLIT